MSLVKSLLNNRKFFTVIFNITLVVCCYLFFSQQNLPSTIEHSDKYGHILVFFILSLLLYRSTMLSIFNQVLLLISVGAGVEIIQSYIPYRSGSGEDVIADIIGILLFYWVARLALVRITKSKTQ